MDRTARSGLVSFPCTRLMIQLLSRTVNVSVMIHRPRRGGLRPRAFTHSATISPNRPTHQTTSVPTDLGAACPEACSALLQRRAGGLRSSRPSAARGVLRVRRTLHASCGARKHAKCSRVGDVQRPRCSDALPRLVPSALAGDSMNRAGGPVTVHAYPARDRYRYGRRVFPDPPGHEARRQSRHASCSTRFARADVAGNAPGLSPRYEDPGLRTLAAKRCR